MLVPSIFKAYDIRGVVGDTLTEESVFLIGRSLASTAFDLGLRSFVVGRDGRISGPSLAAALIKGLQASGADVIDLGMVATPMLYFATESTDAACGVMVTGSHNPPDYNGLKMVLGRQALYGEGILALYQRILNDDFVDGKGFVSNLDIANAYIGRITSDVSLKAPLSIAIDCGNGVAGAFAGKLYRRLGCEVSELFCDVDGRFPNHHPDPADPHNLQALIEHLAVSGEDVGLAFDGDGDRLGVVTSNGEIVYPDRQMILFAEDVLSRNPGAPIVFDVKCSRKLISAIEQAGGRPLMCKTGHSLIKAKLRETGAPLAGEMSGHLFFKERWYGFDDALYAGARLLEILSAAKAQGRSPSEVLQSIPYSISTPELQIALPAADGASVMDLLQRAAQSFFEPLGATSISFIDGVRVEYPDGFGLVRMSNTTPVLVLRFEGDSSVALEKIKGHFRQALAQLRPPLTLAG